MFPHTPVATRLTSYRIVARRDGSIDVTGKGLTAKKAPYFRAFQASGHQRQRVDMTAKIALSEQINRFWRRVE